MKFCMFCSALLIGLLGSNGWAHAEGGDVELLSVKPHTAIERTHACLIVKADAADTADCNDPKCAAGGAAVDMALASKGVKRICKTMDASVNRGFDVTYAVYGQKYTAWTARDPESELNQVGLMAFEDYSPLNPACARMTFKEASARSECAEIK